MLLLGLSVVARSLGFGSVSVSVFFLLLFSCCEIAIIAQYFPHFITHIV